MSLKGTGCISHCIEKRGGAGIPYFFICLATIVVAPALLLERHHRTNNNILCDSIHDANITLFVCLITESGYYSMFSTQICMFCEGYLPTKTRFLLNIHYSLSPGEGLWTLSPPMVSGYRGHIPLYRIPTYQAGLFPFPSKWNKRNVNNAMPMKYYTYKIGN